METRFSFHKRSRSEPVQGFLNKNRIGNIFKASDCFNLKEVEHLKGLVKPRSRRTPRTEEKTSVNPEMSELRERLRDRILVSRAVEKALTRCPAGFKDTANPDLIPMAAKELIEEIMVLELEVMCLEEYLLTLYRKIFNRKISSLHKGTCQDVPRNSVCSPLEQRSKEGSEKQKKVLEDSGIFRCHSSLSHRSGHSFRMSPRSKAAAKAVESYHSLPLSMLEQAEIDALTGENSDQTLKNVLQTPNQISEEMIMCISRVLSDLADSPIIRNSNQDCLLSPFSPSSSPNMNPEEFSRPYHELGMIRSISKNDQKLKAIEDQLNHYRSLVYRLESVDLRKMNHGEKLAFWINVHNALVIHGLIVHEIPKNNLKRISLILKAAYNIGGEKVNVDAIQSSILGCRVPRPGQWLRFFITPKTRSKTGETRRDYAIEHPEPLLHFALSLGNVSDPPVRVYTPKRVALELEAAKEDYIHSNFGIGKDNKILLPKIIDLYAKESDLCPTGIVNSIQHSVAYPSCKKTVPYRTKKTAIDWVSHDFTFGFRLSKELV